MAQDTPNTAVLPHTRRLARPGLALLVLATATAALGSPGPRHDDLSPLCAGPSGARAVALTIDLGQSATERSAECLFAWLDAHHVRTTCFVTGWFVRTYPDLTRRLAAAGHELGNHTDTHPHCRRLARPALREQLRNVEELLRRQGLQVSEPRYFRPPFGEYDGQVVAAAAELGYRTVLWSATSLDYTARGNGDRLAVSLLRRVRPGGIILTHATPVSARLVPALVTALQARGYTVTTLGGLLGAVPQPPQVARAGAAGRSASLDEVARLCDQADEALAAGGAAAALELYRQVLELQPATERARRGCARATAALARQAGAQSGG